MLLHSESSGRDSGINSTQAVPDIARMTDVSRGRMKPYDAAQMPVSTGQNSFGMKMQASVTGYDFFRSDVSCAVVSAVYENIPMMKLLYPPESPHSSEAVAVMAK